MPLTPFLGLSILLKPHLTEEKSLRRHKVLCELSSQVGIKFWSFEPFRKQDLTTYLPIPGAEGLVTCW